ncbi:MAG: hypothetical protein KAT28_01750 [Candidatus Aenigmarchaeota archaeon]|nr:hypothetical protein [Candidatus Aenigmarchaeota archaeon]
MELEEIKSMNLQQMQPIEITYNSEKDGVETRCGYFWGLVELPERMSEIPLEYKHAYPTEPPFIKVAYALDRNYTAKGTKDYCPKDIRSIQVLTESL